MKVVSKARINFRSKSLSYPCMQLKTKAFKNEKAYEIAKERFWKMSKEIDACCQGEKKMKEARSEENKRIDELRACYCLPFTLSITKFHS